MISRERRSARRFVLRVPLTVRWADGGVVGEIATQSRDVSSRGLYFDLPKRLSNGSPIEVVMTLPQELTRAGPVRIQAQGRVIRNSTEYGGNVGVAATIERYEFLQNEPLQE